MDDDGGEYDMYDEMELDDDGGGSSYYCGDGGGFDYGELDYDMM